MSLNKIELNHKLLADLYPDTLIEITATPMPEKPGPRYLGGNKKQVSIVVSHTTVPFLPDGEMNFLTNVLSACKLGIADIAIINFNGTDTQGLQETLQACQARQVLLFNVDPGSMGLPIHFPPFQLQAFDRRTYLHCPGLSDIASDKTLKQKLWNSLKTMFNI